VVSSACYIARAAGVRSAMPMFKALRLCPDAWWCAPRWRSTRRPLAASAGLMERLTPLVQPLSIDEAVLDLSGTAALHRAPPAAVLARFALEVEREVGVTVSVGLAPNRLLAKIAAERDKPRGFAVIGAAEAASLLAPEPSLCCPASVRRWRGGWRRPASPGSASSRRSSRWRPRGASARTGRRWPRVPAARTRAGGAGA
jgi:DNA polymerase-4